MTLRKKGRKTTHVALLRGVNVGGKNKLPMRELARMFADGGCGGVRTYIQSGNVLFAATRAVAARIAALVTERIAERAGLRVPVLRRTVEALEEVAGHNPYPEAGADAAARHVIFLSDAPSPRAVAGLDPGRSGPDAFTVRGSEIYLRCPSGIARSKLTTGYFDARLATTSTIRRSGSGS